MDEDGVPSWKGRPCDGRRGSLEVWLGETLKRVGTGCDAAWRRSLGRGDVPQTVRDSEIDANAIRGDDVSALGGEVNLEAVRQEGVRGHQRPWECVGDYAEAWEA